MAEVFTFKGLPTSDVMHWKRASKQRLDSIVYKTTSGLL